jgi:glucokinase
MYYIGVDLGGTGIKVGLLDEAYHIVQQASAPTLAERPAEEIVADMAKLCKEVIDRQGITAADVHSIGIGTPGIVSRKEGVILRSSNLPTFENVAVREIFKKYLDLEVYLENDANCAALGEARCGAAKGDDNVLVMTLGTGIGGGLLINGELYSGSFFAAGEIGHHVVNWHETEKCGCGRKGCWEQYASARALVGQAQEAARKSPNSQLMTLVQDGNLENMNAKVVFEAAEAGDKVAQDVLDNYFKAVARGITNLINIMQPTSVVIGGGMSAQGEKVSGPIRNYIQDEMYGSLKLQTQIKTAELGNEAGIIGAALLGLN